MVGLLLMFALYLCLIFGIKFDEAQQEAWVEGFLLGFLMDMGIGIPIQICVFMMIPPEVSTLLLYAGTVVVGIYAFNHVAGEVLDMSIFTDVLNYAMIAVFGM